MPQPALSFQLAQESRPEAFQLALQFQLASESLLEVFRPEQESLQSSTSRPWLLQPEVLQPEVFRPEAFQLEQEPPQPALSFP